MAVAASSRRRRWREPIRTAPLRKKRQTVLPESSERMIRIAPATGGLAEHEHDVVDADLSKPLLGGANAGDDRVERRLVAGCQDLLDATVRAVEEHVNVARADRLQRGYRPKHFLGQHISATTNFGVLRAAQHAETGAPPSRSALPPSMDETEVVRQHGRACVGVRYRCHQLDQTRRPSIDGPQRRLIANDDFSKDRDVLAATGAADGSRRLLREAVHVTLAGVPNSSAASLLKSACVTPWPSALPAANMQQNRSGGTANRRP